MRACMCVCARARVCVCAYVCVCVLCVCLCVCQSFVFLFGQVHLYNGSDMFKRYALWHELNCERLNVWELEWKDGDCRDG